MKVLICAVNREKFPDPVFPIGASYITYAAKKAGHETLVFDACFSENPLEDLKNVLITENPEIIGFSIRNVDNNAFPIAEGFLEYYKSLMKVARENSKAKIILGGSGFSIFPDLYMEELNPDYSIKGEGENAFIELLSKISKGEIVEKKLIYSPEIKDINFNYFPDRIGFDIEKYFKYSGCLNIQTKRGCAFNCSYCTYPVLEGHNYRLRSPEKVVDEIEFWYNTKKIDYFFFVDNVFNHPEDYAFKICEEIIRRKLNIHWTGFFIPKIDNPDFLDVCIKSGLTSVDFGTDAFSEKTLNGFQKSFTVDDIFRACEICKSKNIKFNHSMIFGGPNETYETLTETIDNINKTMPTSVIGFIGVRLYAGTPMANQIKDIKIGINPVFYVSEDVKDGIVDFLKEKIGSKKNWIIPGLEKGTSLALIKRIRDTGVKGPLWEMMVNLR